MVARILYILLAVLLFGVLIAVHEFGHFFTAKLLGVKVNEFAIGMGPAFWKKQKGETLYTLRALPIGGFCAMEGEDEETADPRSFARQKAWKKLIILCAGSFMNFVAGLLTVILIYTGVAAVQVPVITSFAGGFSQELAGEGGLLPGDRVVEIDGHGVWCYDDVLTFLQRNDGESGVNLVVERDGKRIELKDFPLYRGTFVYEGKSYTGFGLIFEQTEQLILGGRLKLAFIQTADYVRTVWISLADLVTGRVSVTQMTGVIGVVDVVSQVGAASATARAGILNVLNIMALIAVNLAVMNMLPIPALDGGRAFFVLLNGLLWVICRKRIPAKYEGYVHTGAFILLLGVMALVAFHDVWNIFK